VVLTFLCNLLLIWATGGLIIGLTGGLAEYFTVDIWMVLTTAVTGVEGFNPVSVEIYNGIAYSVLAFPLATDFVGYLGAIALPILPIIPGLGAAIVAGKVGRTSANGFFAMLITGVLVSVVPIALIWGNPYVLDTYGLVSSVYLITPTSWIRAIIFGVFGLLIGAFWGGIAAFFGRE
jgi:phage shock protein PspC (stress-responsive transcriptional regulator)